MFNFKIYLSPDDPCNNKEGIALIISNFLFKIYPQPPLKPDDIEYNPSNGCWVLKEDIDVTFALKHYNDRTAIVDMQIRDNPPFFFIRIDKKPHEKNDNGLINVMQLVIRC